MKIVWVVCSSIITYTAAHIQMSDPLPIRSPLNTNSSIKDYSYASPLSATGSDFPCKGYAGDPFDSVAEYTAGQEYAITLAGTATHGGGSCQISLSYDMGETFRVIQSILGHCPEPLHYSFRIPEDAPHGPALLAWTWFNKIGNREMYMNCAQVTIQSPISDVGALQGEMQQDSWLERPPIFLANINGEGQCVTIEGEEVSFPMPGDSVEGTVAGGTGYTCSSSAAFLSPVASSPSAMASFIPLPVLTTTRPGTIPPGESALSTQSAPYTVTKKDSSSSTIPADSTGLRYSTGTGTKPDITGHVCTPGVMQCSSDGHSFFLCDSGRLVPMGAVAAGTICRNGAIAPAG
ncbi:hypothetical protein AtubIFM54640_011300 [Aspergillus tubingensis]|nr:hypothetical protein AtubIFM54640_011300 [Aspergillus tubingensis]